MSQPLVDPKFIDEFFATIAPVEPGYEHAAFKYIAVRSGDHFAIVQGRLFLNITDPNFSPLRFHSQNVRAGWYTLPELKLDVRGLVEQLTTGKLRTPDDDLYFDRAESGRYAATYVPFHPEGLLSQSRYNVLTVLAGPMPEVRQPDIDWEIKAASPPYDGLQDIANELGVGAIAGPTANVAIVAFNVAFVDIANSKVSGTNADLRIVLARGLKPKNVRLGYRFFTPGTRAVRGDIAGEAIKWTEDGQMRRGQAIITVPEAAAINCAVSYKEIAQQHQWLIDPDKVQNARRAVYETADPKLENLKAMIANASARGQDARQLEAAVSWLLWMMGFNGVHLGAMPKSRDAADLLACTPAGHFAVVECTTGILKAENKLTLLYARAEAVRRSLVASNNTYQRVLPVIVTSKTAAEVTPDIEAAERLGIRVITREGIERIIERTLIQPNADQSYADAEQAVSAALAKYQVQPTPPLSDMMPPVS
jgi:hypothetical protein